MHYGWKNHVKADLKTKLIINATTTPASVHDSQVFKDLLDEKDQAVLADSAYHSEEHEAHLIKLNAQELLMRKATPSPSAEQRGAADQPHHQPDEGESGAHLRENGADGCRPMPQHRIAASHATQPPEQSGLQHGSLRLPGALKKAISQDEAKKESTQHEQTINIPSRLKLRALPSSNASQRWR